MGCKQKWDGWFPSLMNFKSSRDSHFLLFKSRHGNVDMEMYERYHNNFSLISGRAIYQWQVHKSNKKLFYQKFEFFKKVLNNENMGLNAGKPVFGVWDQQRRRPACASAQTDQRLSYFA